ncbi:MAG: FAD:protein FMN transferase [Xanthobacteraceae bacterium]
MPSFTPQFFAMGSDCTLHFHAANEADAHAAAATAISEIARIEARYSRYRAESETSRINLIAATGGSVVVDEETAGLLTYAYACFNKSEGLFDISSGLLRKAWDFSVRRLPKDEDIAALLPGIGLDKIIWENPRLTFSVPGMEIDFGGIGKEYAADRAAGAMLALGVNHGLIDLGGDIRLIGPQPDGASWRIGIRHPRDIARGVTQIELTSGAIATSGDYERFIDVDGQRYCHILNPRTGWPTRGLSSVSVIAEDCLVAGSVATIAMLKGHEGTAWLKTIGVRHVFVDDDGQLGGTEMDLAKKTTP